jgi:lipopolysaccharide export system protein LptA
MKFISLILALIFTSPLFALETDKNEPLHINADRVFLNHQTGVNTYEGNVKLIQGTSELTADTIQVNLDIHNQLNKIVAKGVPARYRTLFAKTKPEVIATASIMEYYPQESRLILIDNAKITEGKNSFEGSRIDYNIQEKTVTSAIADQGQIHITLQPQEKSHE